MRIRWNLIICWAHSTEAARIKVTNLFLQQVARQSDFHSWWTDSIWKCVFLVSHSDRHCRRGIINIPTAMAVPWLHVPLIFCRLQAARVSVCICGCVCVCVSVYARLWVCLWILYMLLMKPQLSPIWRWRNALKHLWNMSVQCTYGKNLNMHICYIGNRVIIIRIIALLLVWFWGYRNTLKVD